MLVLSIAGLVLAGAVGGVLWWTGSSPEKAVEDIVLLPPEPPKPAGPPREVLDAVKRGCAFLKIRLAEGRPLYMGSQHFNLPGQAEVGTHALIGLTLLEAGHPPEDPGVQQALAVVRKEGPRNTMVYSLGAILFFLNRLDRAGAATPADIALVRTLALRLIHGQHQDGKWYYYNNPVPPKAEEALLAQLKSNTFKPTVPGASTSSMTQFAVLALWGCRKHGVPIRQPILHAAAAFHDTQAADGSWNYLLKGGHQWTDSNTCAGLLTLAMEKVLREDGDFRHLQGTTDPSPNPRTEEQLKKGFAYLEMVVDPGKEAKSRKPVDHSGSIFQARSWGDLYFLWCVERTAVIYGLDRIGSKDWYAWASQVLLKNQHADGWWKDRHGATVDTCFAILVLMKANLARDLSDKWRQLQNTRPTPGVASRD